MNLCLALLLVVSLVVVDQATAGCKNCVMIGKAERAMFRAHSAACAAQSGVRPEALEALLTGALPEPADPALRRHVYCVLLKCKVVGKDGKLQKAVLLGKMAAKVDKNATKVLESCAGQQQEGDTPEDLAWNLFRCGYDKKAVLFNYMPPSEAVDLNSD